MSNVFLTAVARQSFKNSFLLLGGLCKAGKVEQSRRWPICGLLQLRKIYSPTNVKALQKCESTVPKILKRSGEALRLHLHLAVRLADRPLRMEMDVYPGHTNTLYVLTIISFILACSLTQHFRELIKISKWHVFNHFWTSL